MFLLDTDTCSAHLKRPGGLAHRFIQHTGRLFISSVSAAELFAGAYLSSRPERLLSAIGELLSEIPLVHFDRQTAIQFGQMRAEIRATGMTVSPLDLLIAATARAHSYTLVTHNTVHFVSIPGISVDDWLTD
jgi:tRNA(fMet)-specific endonuclease VapC